MAAKKHSTTRITLAKKPRARRPDRSPDEAAEVDADWPPKLDHQTEIELGNGERFHFLGSGDALLRAGVLDADEIPGNPACKYRWRTLSAHDGKWAQAVRLGDAIAVTVLDGETTSIIRCPVLKLR